MPTRTPIPVMALALAIAGSSGCASVPEPRGELSAADLALRRAEQADAGHAAALEMRSARDQYASAKEAVARGDNLAGRRLAENAAVEAQLAEAMAREVRAQQVASDARENLNALRNEADRTGGGQ
jgi:hypothetical protein